MATQNAVGTSPKTCFVTQFTEQSTSDLEGVGTLRRDQYGKVYRWVKNSSDNAARVGAPACFDEGNVAQTYFMERCITEDEAAGDIKYLAGVWLAAVAGESYGWVQVWGVYDTARVAPASAGAVVAGDLMVPGASTDTTETNTSRPHCFITQLVQGVTIATGAGDLDSLRNPHVVAMDALTAGSDDPTATVAGTISVFVKGLL